MTECVCVCACTFFCLFSGLFTTNHCESLFLFLFSGVSEHTHFSSVPLLCTPLCCIFSSYWPIYWFLFETPKSVHRSAFACAKERCGAIDGTVGKSNSVYLLFRCVCVCVCVLSHTFAMFSTAHIWNGYNSVHTFYFSFFLSLPFSTSHHHTLFLIVCVCVRFFSSLISVVSSPYSLTIWFQHNHIGDTQSVFTINTVPIMNKNRSFGYWFESHVFPFIFCFHWVVNNRFFLSVVAVVAIVAFLRESYNGYCVENGNRLVGSLVFFGMCVCVYSLPIVTIRLKIAWHNAPIIFNVWHFFFVRSFFFIKYYS